MHLKYAFKSGPYLFAICNYDDEGEHAHSDHHYVCRTPLNGQSKIGDIETFCYDMGFFHRTCNPHKALVSTEIITINSKGRWADLDKTVLKRFLNNNKQSFLNGFEPAVLINVLERAKVHYPSYARGASISDTRYPKVFEGTSYACIESLLSSNTKYIESRVSCGDYEKVRKPGNRGYEISLKNVFFQKTMKRLKQIQVSYPMFHPEVSSVE